MRLRKGRGKKSNIRNGCSPVFASCTKKASGKGRCFPLLPQRSNGRNNSVTEHGLVFYHTPAKTESFDDTGSAGILENVTGHLKETSFINTLAAFTVFSSSCTYFSCPCRCCCCCCCCSYRCCCRCCFSSLLLRPYGSNNNLDN